MKINLFTPPKFIKKEIDLKNIEQDTKKRWHYSSKGRVSLYHILKPLKTSKILIPAYICSTVLEPLKRLGIEAIFYDLDIGDLNPSLESIKYLSKKFDVKVVLVASMYGNPANLEEIEAYCKENEIFMIDDGAQSWSAKLNNKYIGAFGNAGFFSFSPGKPTAGHMGSFFWSDKIYDIIRTKHCFLHFVNWVYFYFVRYNGYKTSGLLKKIWTYVYIIVNRTIDIYDDDICSFEKKILGGILESKFEFRKFYTKSFSDKFKSNQNFKVLREVRGESNPHKIVVVFFTKEQAKEFLLYMKKNNISVLNGYSLLTEDLQYLPNAKKVDKKVVELPIEDDEKKMNYLFKKVEEFNGI